MEFCFHVASLVVIRDNFPLGSLLLPTYISNLKFFIIYGQHYSVKEMTPHILEFCLLSRISCRLKAVKVIEVSGGTLCRRLLK